MFNKKSKNGISVKVLKSGLQKYIRRGDVDKSIWCFIELITLGDKGIRTNALNRLVAIMSEDIGIACPWLPSQMLIFYNRFQSHKSSKSEILSIIKTLCKLPKIRLISDFKTYYNLPPYYLDDLKKLNDLHSNLLKKFNIEEPNSKESSEANFELFKEFLIKRDQNSLWYLSKILANKNFDVKQIWNFLLKKNLFNSNNLFQIFEKLNHREKPIYLYHAIQCHLFYDDNIKADIDQRIEFVSEKEAQDYYKKNLNNELVIFDSFVYDQHVNPAHKEYEKFAVESALVLNECTKYLDPLKREMYVEFKRMLDSNEKISKKRKMDDTTEVKLENMGKAFKLDDLNEKSSKKRKMEDKPEDKLENDGKKINSDYLNTKIVPIDEKFEEFIYSLPHAQKITGAHKKCVYLNLDKKEIYKGLYNLGDKQLIRNIKNAQNLKVLESKLGLEDSCVLDWKCLFKTSKGKYFLVQDMIENKNVKSEIKIESSKIETNVKILSRKMKCSQIDLNDAEILTCLQHLYLRQLLEIGDSGPHNMLMNSERKIFGIDFEEKTTNKESLGRNIPKSWIRLVSRIKKITPHMNIDIKQMIAD